MAGHLEVSKANQIDLIIKIQNFLNSNPILNMTAFVRYKQVDNLVWQRLTDRNEEGDAHVLSVYPWTFKFDDGEVCEFAIAEIHLAEDFSINKIYMVM